jgi:hypothetical protein
VHGSGPKADAQRVAEYYHPALRMDGTAFPVVAMTGQSTISRRHE